MLGWLATFAGIGTWFYVLHLAVKYNVNYVLFGLFSVVLVIFVYLIFVQYYQIDLFKSKL